MKFTFRCVDRHHREAIAAATAAAARTGILECKNADLAFMTALSTMTGEKTACYCTGLQLTHIKLLTIRNNYFEKVTGMKKHGKHPWPLDNKANSTSLTI